MTDQLDALQESATRVDSPDAWFDRPALGARGPGVWRHRTSVRLALVWWATALAVGIAAGALTDPPPAGQEARRRPEGVAEADGPDTTPLTTIPPTTSIPVTTTEPPTTVAPTTTTVPPPPSPQETAAARCDAARAAAQQAHAALDGAYRTLTELTDAAQAATDADTRARQVCEED